MAVNAASQGLEASVDGEDKLTRRLAERFGEQAAHCASLEQLSALLAEATRDLGFRYFALVHHVSAAMLRDHHLRIHNYPLGWVAEFDRRKLDADDPVHCAARRTNAGFEWSQIDRIVELQAHQRAVLVDCRTFGIGEGFTVPANLPGEPGACCSFAMATDAEIPREQLMGAQLIGLSAFETARRLARADHHPARPHLSPREVQCLRLIAGGKTDWEISVILGISVETVRQYVKRARRAYDAVSRAQLVVRALRDSWLEFDDTIPP